MEKLDLLLKELYSDLEDIYSYELDEVYTEHNLDDIYSLYGDKSSTETCKKKESYLQLDTNKPMVKEKKSFFSFLKKNKKRKIFKVISDYSFTGSKDLLAFKKGQIFFVLQEDEKNGLYFVSTSSKTPFSDHNLAGYVPVSYFRKY